MPRIRHAYYEYSIDTPTQSTVERENVLVLGGVNWDNYFNPTYRIIRFNQNKLHTEHVTVPIHQVSFVDEIVKKQLSANETEYKVKLQEEKGKLIANNRRNSR